MIIALIKDFPPINAKMDSPTFTKMLIINVAYWLFSKRLVESSANADIVVSEPQNPTAVNKEYLPSRCQCCDIMTNAPRRNAPRIFTIRMLTGNVLKSKGDSVILYRRYAPNTEPTPRKINSKPFICSISLIEGISVIWKIWFCYSWFN